MGLKYLWDTNTAIYYLQQQFPPSAEKFIDETLLAGFQSCDFSDHRNRVALLEDRFGERFDCSS